MDGANAGLVVADLDPLIATLRARGPVVAPTMRDGVVVLDEITKAAEIVEGVSAQSYKRFLYPPRLTLWTARATPLRIEGYADPVAPFTLFGAHACDLAALDTLDRVLLAGSYEDADYRRRRDAVLIVAVACTSAAPTCFCASTGSGPVPERGYDLRLTELDGPVLIEAGSERGNAILSGLDGRTADDADLATAAWRRERARQQRRSLPKGTSTALAQQAESTAWAEIATRCLACGACTQVCPTCFCATVDHTVDLRGASSVASRSWGSCFTTRESYVHGGALRASRASRYRQWLTHKLSSWRDQFGVPGCVGCGRCITWCPAGIDLTAEASAFTTIGGGPTA